MSGVITLLAAALVSAEQEWLVVESSISHDVTALSRSALIISQQTHPSAISRPAEENRDPSKKLVDKRAVMVGRWIWGVL